MVNKQKLKKLRREIKNTNFPNFNRFFFNDKDDEYTYNNDSMAYHLKMITSNKCPSDSKNILIKQSFDETQPENVDSLH